MLPQRERKEVRTRGILIALVAVLAVLLVSLVMMAAMLPWMSGGPEETEPSAGEATGVTGEPTEESQEPTDMTQEPTDGTQEATKPTEGPTQGPLASDPGVTPSYGKYMDVGSGYIAEVVTYMAETFNGSTVDDASHPTNVYLPEGTLDYCDMDLVQLGKMSYTVLRSGQRVYMEKKDSPTANMVQVVKRYEGWLPDHNEIGFASMEKSGRHTILTLDCLWKAPFYFDIKPQRYQNPSAGSDRNYSVTAFTAEYVDITFCYATVFEGTVVIPGDSRVFSRAELKQQESDCILRLYLKEKGGFYGWDAYYNDQGQLCFRFLEPAQVSAADNSVGADLSGVKIVIDVGHGGFDPGSVGELNGQEIHEADRNMALAQKLRQQLEAAGATVVMTRTTDVKMTVDERNRMLKKEAPNYCISIHHNAIDGFPDYGGFETFYYTPYSMLPTSKVLKRTIQSGVYDKNEMNWHIFFLARQTVCPVVLTENGYMSCEKDLAQTLDETAIGKKALAMAKGIGDYFLEISK